jgi:hypothetical protein
MKQAISRLEEIGKQIGEADVKGAKEAEKRVRFLGKCLTTAGTLIGHTGALANLVLPGASIVTDALAKGAAAGGELASQAGDAIAQRNEINSPLPKIKRELQDALRSLHKRVLVVVDDVDRLTAEEVKLLFQLIKANSDFPNLIFLVLFERRIVEDCLEKTIRAGSGKDYLEKVVHVGFDLPQIPRLLLDGFVREQLEVLLKRFGIENSFDWRRWLDDYVNALRPYFINLRDVYRFFGTLEFHMGVFAGPKFEVNPVDLFSLEVLRVFEPRAYHLIAESKTILFGDARKFSFSNFKMTDEERAAAARTKILAKVAETDKERVGEVLECLFPNSQANSQFEWQRELRICHCDFFDRYFQLCIPEGDLAQAELEEVVALQGRPGHHHRHGRADQHDRIGRRQRDVEVLTAVRPDRRAGAQEDVRREQGAEEHDLRGEEQPDADLAVVEAGVRPHRDGVGNLDVAHACAFSHCGVKSLDAPGTLYS